MPHKFNADRRDKIAKEKHRVTNWAEYNESLRRRGDLTVWISKEARDLSTPARRTTPGGLPVYSDLAIETCPTLGMVFRQPLSQTQGLVGSIARLLGIKIAVPSFFTLSRRGKALTLPETRHSAFAKSSRSRPMAGWHGRSPQDTISTVGLKL